MKMKFTSVLSGEEDCQSLKQKLLRQLPHQQQDIVATALFLILLPLWYLFHFFTLLPTWYPTFGEAWVIRVVPYAFLLFNVYANWAFMMYHGPNGRSTVLPNTVTAGFKFCHHCQANAPPRAHHCPSGCNTCVFRRDHHCSFGGVCVGHFNQRYFIASIIHLWLISLIFVYYSLYFVSMQFEGGLTLSRYWQLAIPHVALLLRFLTLSQFLCSLVLAFNTVIFFFTTYLVAAQAFCLWRGQTRVEYLLNVHAYQLGLLENIRQACGTRWPLILLSPALSSPLPSNGLSYHTSEFDPSSSKNL